MKSLLAFSISYSVSNAKVLKTPLPGVVTISNANLEAGLHGDFAPANRAEIEAAYDHLKDFRPALQAAEREEHVVTDSPVIGVLKLPMYNELEQQLNWSPDSYISASHVKFLESAGARVLPIDLGMNPKELQILMKKLNGVYIPGDHNVRGNQEFFRTVSDIVQHAQMFNEEAGNHFPIAAFGYGGLVMLQDSVKNNNFGHKLTEDLVEKRFKLDYTKHPDDTFLFDSIKEVDLVETFLRSYYYNTLAFGVSLQELRHNQEAIKSYSPTLVLKDSGDLIAGFEAHAFPFYGFTLRLD
jgi:hypothetical protein